MTTSQAIEVSGLTKSYGDTRVLDGIDLEVPPGTVFSLLGPNGAGKTTAVRIMATLGRADSGSVRIAGFDVVNQRHEVRRRISLTGQYAALDELQSGYENLLMMGRLLGLRGAASRARATELLTQFDLFDAARRRVGTYSGGMRRRLDLAASLVGRPEVIFLDEPTTGLDPRSRLAMWDVVAALAASGATVFLTTQYLDEVDRLADRVAVLECGRVVAIGTAEQLKRQVGGQRLDLVAVDAVAYEELASAVGLTALASDRTSCTISVATDGTASDVLRTLDRLDTARRRVLRFDIHGSTLDDVFMALTGHSTEKETSNV